MPTQALPLHPSQEKNAMETVHKYLPCRFELNSPVEQDRLLNSLFPETINTREPCHCESGKAHEINRYLDILTEIYCEQAA